MSSDIFNWPVERHVDGFISDVLLPSTKELIGGQDLYELFVQYCGQIGLGVPCGNSKFGTLMKARFQKRRRTGRSYYYCEVNPRVLAGDSGVRTVDELRIIELINEHPEWEIRELPKDGGIYIGTQADYIEEQLANVALVDVELYNG